MVAVAFFDLDKTIIAKSSTLAFTRPMFRAGLLSGPTLAKAGIAQAYYQAFGADHGQLERMRDELSAMTKGWDRAEIEALVTETVNEVVAPLVYAEALAIIEDHRGKGRRVVVISASPEEIVRPLCRYLGIDEVIATKAQVDDDGKYTGEIELYAYGEGKAEAMRDMAAADGIDLAGSAVGHRLQVPARGGQRQAARDPGQHRSDRAGHPLRRDGADEGGRLDRRERDPPQPLRGRAQGRPTGRHRRAAQGR